MPTPKKIVGLYAVFSFLLACIGLFTLVRGPLDGAQLASPILAGIVMIGIPAIVFLFSSLAFFGKLDPANVSMALISSTISIYALEGGLNFLKNKDAKIDVLVRLREQGVNASPAIGIQAVLEEKGSEVHSRLKDGEGHELVALTGIAGKTTVYCKEQGPYLVYDADEYGFHNPKDTLRSASSRIVAIGDSFVHGACVGGDKNMIALLRAKGWPIGNLGSGGAGPLAELAAFREYAAPLKPKVVLWFYALNDFRDLNVEKRNSVLKSYLDPKFSQGLVAKRPQAEKELERLISDELMNQISHEEHKVPGMIGVVLRTTLFLRIPNLRAILLPKRISTGIIDHEIPDPDFPLFEKILGTAKREVEAWGGEIVFVYLPAMQDRDQDNHDKMAAFKKRVLAVPQTLGIAALDIDDRFAATGHFSKLFTKVSSHLASYYGHFNEEGYRVAAEALDETLRKIAPAEIKPKP